MQMIEYTQVFSRVVICDSEEKETLTLNILRLGIFRLISQELFTDLDEKYQEYLGGWCL